MFKSQTEFVSQLTSGDTIADVDKTFTHIAGDVKFNVRPNKVTQFWERYCELVDTKQRLSISERIHIIAPLICDMKFQFNMTEDDLPELNDTFILHLVSVIQQTISEIFEVDNNNKLFCLYLAPPDGEENAASKTVTYSVRFQFPEIRVEPIVVRTQFYPRLIESLRLKHVLSKLEASPIGDWNQIIDDKVMDHPILMFGSNKNVFDKTKELNRIIGYIQNENLVDDDLPELELNMVFSYDRHQDVDQHLVRPKQINDDLDWWLPLFCSLKYGKTITNIRQDNVPSKVEIQTTTAETTRWSDCLEFIRMIPEEEKNKMHIFIDIGRVLYSESIGSEDGLKEWLNNLKGKTEIDSYAQMYRTFGGNTLTMKTVAWYARQFNQIEYDRWHKKKMDNKKEKALSKTEFDVAAIIYWSYWLDFVYATSHKSKNSGKWYKFVKNRWIMMDQALDLHLKISDDDDKYSIYSMFEKMSFEEANKRNNSDNSMVKDACTVKIRKIEDLNKRLKTHAFKESVLKEARALFKDENFYDITDMNNKVMGHANCVHEVVGDEIIMRSGKPEDYITKSTHVIYDKNMDRIMNDGRKEGWKHPQVEKFMKWMRQVFVEDSLIEFFVLFCASLMIGGNPDKFIPCATGEGDNSKSIVEKSLEKLLGDYCFKFSNQSITGKQQGSGPTPELAQSKGARLGIVDELEEDDQIKVGFLKKISGGDTFFARFLQDNGGKIESSFKILMVCNVIPRMNSFNKAIKRRFLPVPFNSTWVDKELAPITEEEQMKQRRFPADKFIEDDIPKMLPAMLWVFKEKFRNYKRNGLVIPNSIKVVAEGYWKEVDYYQMFITENIENAYTIDNTGKQIRDKEAKVEVGKCYNYFKTWFKSTNEGNKAPSIREFRADMDRSLGSKAVMDKYWIGIKFIERMGSVEGDGNQQFSLLR